MESNRTNLESRSSAPASDEGRTLRERAILEATSEAIVACKAKHNDIDWSDGPDEDDLFVAEIIYTAGEREAYRTVRSMIANHSGHHSSGGDCSKYLLGELDAYIERIDREGNDGR